MRRDAGYVAAEIATFARRLALELGGAQVATVGRFEVHPDLVNVVPNGATLTVDLRNTDDAVLRRAEQALAAEVARLADGGGRDGHDTLAGPLRAGRLRWPDRRPRRGDGDSGWGIRPGACRAVPATTPRCWPASARRR